jgi:hypothetical protein
MSESDFMDITCNGTLCNADGEIGHKEFETIMRKEVTTYLQTRLTDFSDFRTSEDIEFTQLGALKTILSEVLILIKEQRSVREEMKHALDQMQQGSRESSITHSLDGGLQNSHGTKSTEAVKELQDCMKSLAAELVGVKAFMKEHAAELRQTSTTPQSAHEPPGSPYRNTATLDTTLGERRRRPPRRDWGTFVRSSSSRYTAPSAPGSPPTPSSNNLPRSINAVQITENPVFGAGQHVLADQGCLTYAESYKMTSPVETVSEPRRNSRMPNGKMKAAAAVFAEERVHQKGAAAQVAMVGEATVEHAAPVLLDANSAETVFQLAEVPSDVDGSNVFHHAAPRTSSYLPVAKTEAITLEASPIFEGQSNRSQRRDGSGSQSSSKK